MVGLAAIAAHRAQLAALLPRLFGETWTVLGASRGEGGILGEGIRQALLRDPAYRSALDCGEALLQ